MTLKGWKMNSKDWDLFRRMHNKIMIITSEVDPCKALLLRICNRKLIIILKFKRFNLMMKKFTLDKLIILIMNLLNQRINKKRKLDLTAAHSLNHRLQFNLL